MGNKKRTIHKKYRQLIIIKCYLIASLLVQGFFGDCQVTALTVIRNVDGAPSVMKLAELRSVMKGEKQRWNGGAKVTVALMKTTTPVGKNTAEVIYNMSGDALLKFFLRLSYQGYSHTPKFFNTTSELQSYVAQNPGAIGIIDQSIATNEINIVIIDGKTQFNL